MPPQDSTAGRREMLLQMVRLGGLGAGAAGLGLWLRNRSQRPAETAAAIWTHNVQVPPNPDLPEIVVVQGEDPRQLVQKAMEELGGVNRFIAKGDVVAIKPNMAWDRTPEQAANTNPAVVAEVVRLCLEAGAKRVIVADVSINEPRRCYQRSGIAEAARLEGATILLPEERHFKEVDLHGEVLGAWPVFAPFLAIDKMINIPAAKHHSLTGATLGLKNWYGIIGGPRHRLHQRIHESLADLADFMRPTLTIIDAYRVLLRNGPSGGNLEDVAVKKTLIAGTDAVALDAYAAKAFWDLDAERLPYLKLAAGRGLGKVDFEKSRIRVTTNNTAPKTGT